MFVRQVVKGDGEGSVLGYPTANFNITYQELGLSPGVYATRIQHKGVEHRAALCVHGDIEKVEAFILDYVGGPLYGEVLQVEPLDKVSDFRNCTSLSELKAKIASDVSKVRVYFEDNAFSGQ